MYVLIGKTQIENHEIIQLRYALEDREAVLKKAINAAENARLPTQAASADLETCKSLAALLDPASHDSEETRRTQLALLARIRRALAPEPDVRRIEEGSEEPEAQEPEETETAAAGA